MAKKVERATHSVSLVTQGKHRFFTLTMPSDVLWRSSTVDARDENPIDGFQRRLDEKRARDIARYIDEGPGTIPSSIVLSAQAKANLVYSRERRSITYDAIPGAFLIIDGQHRVFGFSLAKSKLRVPVVIYKDLSRVEECRLFVDINTKQRPVPNELLLDIKKLAELENEDESDLRAIFDLFAADPSSPLLGMLSSSAKARNMLSRVTFNAGLRSIATTLPVSSARKGYEHLAAYLHPWVQHLEKQEGAELIANPTLFRAIMLMFPDVAERVYDRHQGDMSAENFREVLAPVFNGIKASQVRKPGSSHVKLYQTFQRTLRSQFSLAGL